MSVDNTKLLFSSNWDIDQVFASDEGTVTIAAGSGWPGAFSGVATRSTVDITHDKNRKVICSLRYQVGTYWFESGTPLNSAAPYNSLINGVQGAWIATAPKVQLIFINSTNSAQTITYRYELIEDNITLYGTIS